MYQRFEQKGRLLSEGVIYLDNWIDEKVEVCNQLMESESLGKWQEWIRNWEDVADFQIVPVISSDQACMQVLSS